MYSIAKSDSFGFLVGLYRCTKNVVFLCTISFSNSISTLGKNIIRLATLTSTYVNVLSLSVLSLITMIVNKIERKISSIVSR